MLKKLFKYEWKTVSPLLLGIHGVGLVVAIFCRIGIQLMGGIDGNPDLMVCLLLVAAIMAIGCVAVYTYFYGGYRFYKSVFTQQGYLTNTLPVTADQLIWGKGFTLVIWSALDFLWVVVVTLILVLTPKEAGEFLCELPQALTSLFRPAMPLFGKLIMLTVLLSPFCAMLQLYVSAAVGNLFTGHKLLATVGAYLGIGFVQQILGLVILGIAFPRISALDAQVKMQMSAGDMTLRYYTPAEQFMNLTMGLALLFNVVCAVGFYFLCRYVLNRKLNLE